MSLFKKILGVAAPIVGGIFGGPAGAALGASIGGSLNAPRLSPLSLAASPAPSVSPMLTMGALPPIVGRALPMIGAAGGVIVAGGRAVIRSAQVYCTRHPAWCSTIGGTAAVAAMIESGQLPAIRRRRGRGITPRDLRSFRRVANLVRGFCPTVRRIPTRALHVRRTGITHA